ncbi:MAG: OadG family protein [Spirochaetales bacterium]|nr:OadG family protein [Spirochaetales bacterium]MDD7272171.1 OadG family protein [Spirochaetales bacterium]
MPKEVLVKQIQDGLVLLVLGMGTVFVFLTILIFTTKLLSKVCARFAPAKPATPAPKKSTAAPQNSGVNKDAEIAAAIAAAYARSNN